ncbi:SDR family oxidoreductase [Corynebacterium lubricantis]|uniref:SDR family oxidoreductase n=1 Tax=Corynebacterium lubricantis TaxID=541095 RepID=UPI0003733903|nr:SDR family oxidoreductase [Corynebacterium lubricantis]
MYTITIIGGHGKVALRTAPLLVEAGHTVKSVIRNPDHAEDVSATGATPVVADIENMDADETAKLLEGSNVVVWAAGAGGGNPDRTWAVDRDAAIRTMDAAQSLGIHRFIMVSYFNTRLKNGRVPGIVESDGMYAYYNAKSQADEHLKMGGLDWTILGPSGLTLDEPSGKITVDNSGAQVDNQVPTTARGNVAQAIAAAVENQSSIGKLFSFHDGDTPIAEAIR